MMIIKRSELVALLEWAKEIIRSRWPDDISLPHDLYWQPAEISDFFNVGSERKDIDIGSLEDGMSFLRESVLAGQDDVLSLVLERLAFIIFAISTEADLTDRIA